MMGRPATIAVVAVTVASLTVVGLLGSIGAGGDTTNGSTPVRALDDVAGRWAPVNDVGAPAAVIGPMSLTFSDGYVLVETGCNTGRGGASVSDSRLVVEALATTRKACLPALAGQEAWVLDMLTNGPRMELSGPTLSLHWGADEEFWIALERNDGAPVV